MLMKNGEPVPAPLAEALAEDDEAAAVFAVMRPSCQRQYAQHVAQAAQAATAQARAGRMVHQIRAWGQRHGYLVGPPATPDEPTAS